MNYMIENLIMRQLQMYSFLVFGLTIVMSALYLLPGIQALFAYNKKKWLEKQFAATASSGEAESKFRKKLLEASEPGQSYPIYKIFKFYFASFGIAAILIGFLIVVLPDDLGPDALDWLLFIPLIVGAGLYFLYNTVFQGHGLYREIAAVFAFIGFAATSLMAFGQYEMYEWLREDILAFFILGVGGFIVWHMQSTLVSYLYMIAVTIAGATVGFGLEDNWLNFLPQFLWVFAIAILYIWIPKLRAAKDVGPKEIIFGILFAAMILSLTMTQLSASTGLMIPALAVVLPGLYIFSKAYFHKAENIIGRPIEIFIIAIVIIMASTLSTNAGMTGASDSIFLFKQYSFEKQISYFVLLGLMAGIFWIFNNDMDEGSDDINPLIALGPLLAFIVAYIFGEYGGHYIMTLFLLGLGYLYVRKGIEKKDGIRVGLGATIFVYTLIIKLTDVVGEENLFEDRTTTGLTVILYGALFLGAIIYIRSQWMVTNPAENAGVNDDVLDNVGGTSEVDPLSEE
ncbi:MAG: hypothetical protein Crog4KO_14860 [Crocinitomicaceae bacterium]